MALQVGSGEITITAAGGTGSHTYPHGLSFTPQLTLWFANGRAAGGASDVDGLWMFGATQDSTHEFCIYGWSDDANANSLCGSGTSNDASIAFPVNSTSYDMQADFTSVDGTNFTLNISDAPAADKVIQYVSLAGTALSVNVGTVTIASGTSAQAFTGVGFLPKAIIFARGGLVTQTVNTVAASIAFSLGMNSSTSALWTLAESDRSGQAASDANTVIGAVRALTVPTVTGTTGGAFNLTSYDADGFTVTPTTDFGGNTVVGYVALAGANFSAKAGTGAASTTVTTKAFTGVGFKPQVLLTAGSSGVTLGTSVAAARTHIGVAHGSSNRVVSMTANDNADPTNTAVATSATKNMQVYSAASNAVLIDASLSSFDSDGFTENYTTADATAKLFGYLALMENAAPVITSNGGGATASINVAENTTAVTTVTATDAEGATLVYSKSGTDSSFFSIDSSSGVLTFTAAPNFEAPGDANADNAYLVTVTASDGTLTDTQDLTVTVTNAAPVISSNGGGATAAINVAENTTAVTTVVAADPAGGTITYSISAGNDSALFGIGSSSGILTFLAAPDFENPTDANTDNDYLVTVRASDGSLTDTQALTITVTNASAPSITSNGSGATAAIDVVENTTAVTTVTASAAAAGTLVYSISAGDDSALFGIDSSTGVLQFLAAPDYENPIDADTDNDYLVTVKVTENGAEFDTQAITVTVTDQVGDTGGGGGFKGGMVIIENHKNKKGAVSSQPFSYYGNG